MTTKTLGDFGIKSEGVGIEKDSQSLSNFKEETLMQVIGFECRDLGKNPGIIFDLNQPVTDINGENWMKVTTTNRITIDKFKGNVKLEKGDILDTHVKSGITPNGTWFDLK